MENKKRYLLMMIIGMILVISVGTYAWLSYRSSDTAMVLTIGEVGSINITLAPYKFNSSIAPTITYEGNDYVSVTAKNEGSELYNIKLYYKINDIPEELIDSSFKYTILRSIDGEVYEEYDGGNFSNAANGSEYIILDEERLESNVTYYYQVYLWIEGSLTNNTEMQGKVFNAELRADYEKIVPDLQYNVIKVNDTTSNTIDSGFYKLSNYTCRNGTTLTFDSISREITANGIDRCDLEFTQIDNPLLYDVVEIGDYVSYTGNNGCSTTNQSSDETCANCNACSGWNAEQTNTDKYENYGYCYDEIYSFYAYGWRVLYKSDNSVYIVSAGSTECLVGTSNDSTTTKTNLNKNALKYCNASYLFGGVCDETTAYALNGGDFYKFTSSYYGSDNGRFLSFESDGETLGETYGEPYCYWRSSNKTYCGYNNDMIDNGSYYWFSTSHTSKGTLYWDPTNNLVRFNANASSMGLRPVLKLDSTIRVTGGEGTMINPYKITEREVSE